MRLFRGSVAVLLERADSRSAAELPSRITKTTEGCD